MRAIWGLDGCRVFASGITSGGDAGIVGCAIKRNGSFYTWEAFPKPHGWYVITRLESTGWEESLQGSTFNLGLEVATAVQRSR